MRLHNQGLVHVHGGARRVNYAAVVSIPPVTPSTIADLTATAQSANSVLLAFTPATDSTYHQYRIDGGSPVTCDDNTGSQLVSGLDASTAYDFEVRGNNAGTPGAWSNLDSATTDAAADVTAPTLSLPTGVQTGPTTATVGATTDEGGGVLYWVVTTSSTTPTAAQIIAGEDHTGATAIAGSVPVGSTGAKTDSVTGLTASTAYYAHLAQTDLTLNPSNEVTSAQFTTAAAPDVTKPILSSPTDAANGAAGGTLSVSTDEANGTLFPYVSTSATPPSATDLKAGTGAAWMVSQPVTATGVQNATATGLTASTPYYTHFLHRDDTGNDSDIVSADGFTTSSVTAPVLTRTSTAGDNPMTWSGAYTDMIVGTDYITMRHRVNGGSWVNSTNHLFTSDDYLDSIDGTAVFAWDAYDAATFAPSAFIEVQEGVLRDGVTTWSSTLSDTMAATGSALPQSPSIGIWLEAATADLFQSNAGSTAVAADSDPVGFWNDKSANGFDLSAAANDTTRPLFKTSAGINWVEFDGTNDLLRRIAALNLWNASGYTAMIAMRSLTPATARYLVSQAHSTETNTTMGVVGTNASVSTSSGHHYTETTGGTTVLNNSSATSGGTFSGSDVILTVVDNGSSVIDYVDGAAGTSRSYTRGSNVFTMNTFALGGRLRTTAGAWFPARVHALVVWPGVVLDSTERAQARIYLASLQGRTIT